jgi:hypothetical protein
MHQEVIQTIVKQVSRKRGGFKKDGSTHYSGIKNEHSIVDFLNQDTSIIGKHLRPSTNYIIHHKGGTQTKADAVVFNQDKQIEETTLSIKNHKTGTFDWLNTTKGFPEDLQNLLKERTKEIRTSFQNHQNIEQSRTEIDSMFSNALNQIKDNDCFVRDIIHTIFQKYTDGILIHHEKEQTLIYFEKKELSELCTFEGDIYFLKHKEGSCSAQIMRKNKSTGEEINTFLRIRFVLNNGVNALVGQSSKNKTSTPCLKIQQDNVDDFIIKIPNKLSENIYKNNLI